MRIEEAVEQKEETVNEVLQPPPALVKEADVKPLSLKRNLESEKIGRLGYLPEREHRTVPPETDSETSKHCRLTGPPNQTQSQTDQPNRG